jgi:hypothetical protein
MMKRAGCYFVGLFSWMFFSVSSRFLPGGRVIAHWVAVAESYLETVSA